MYESDNQAQTITISQEPAQSIFNPKITESLDIGSGLLKYQMKNYGQSAKTETPIVNGYGAKESELYKPDYLQDRPILNSGVQIHSFEKNKDLTLNTASSNTQDELRELEEMSSKVDSLLHNSYKDSKRDISVTSPFLQPQTNVRVEDSYQPSEPPKTASDLGSAYAFHSKSEILKDIKFSTAELYSPEYLVSPTVNPSSLRNQEVIHRSIDVNPYLSPSVTPVYNEFLREKELKMATPEYVSYPKKTSTLYSSALYQDIKEVKQVFQSHNLNKLDQIVENIRKRSQGVGVSYTAPPVDRYAETASLRSPVLNSSRPQYEYDRERFYTESSTVRFQSPRVEVSNFQGDRDYYRAPIESIRRTNIEPDRLTTATSYSRSTAFDKNKLYSPAVSSRIVSSHVPLKLKNDKPLAVDQKERMLSLEEQEGAAPQRYAIPDPTVKEKDRTQERGANHLQSRPIHMPEMSSYRSPGRRDVRSNNYPEYYEEEREQRPQRIRGDKQQTNRVIQKREPSFSPPERDEEYIEPVQQVQKQVRARPYRQQVQEQPKAAPTRKFRPQQYQRVHQNVEASPPYYTQNLEDEEEERQKAAPTRKIRPQQQYERVNQNVEASPPYYTQNLVEDDDDSVMVEEERVERGDRVERVREREHEHRGHAKGAKQSKVNHQPEVKGGSTARRSGQRRGQKLSNDDGMLVKSRDSSVEKAPRLYSKVGGRGQSSGRGQSRGGKVGVERLFDREGELDDFVFE